MSKNKVAAIYVRVSADDQNHKSQIPDLERWAESYEGEVKWYWDKQTGANFSRKGWKELEADMRSRKLSKLVCWRIDRLGRTTTELLQLRDELISLKMDFVSMMDGVPSLDSPGGRLMFTVLASVAEYEREIRGERQRAGIAVAKKEGKYLGRKKGSTKAKPKRAMQLKEKGLTINEIASSLGVSRNTVFVYLRQMKADSNEN